MPKDKKVILLGDGSRWQPVGGTSRNFINLDTGQRLPRRQFDKLSGRMGAFGSYEAKSAASPEPVRLSRPARGRKAQQHGPNFARVQPLTGKMSRYVHIPFQVFRSSDAGEFLNEAEDYRSTYNGAIQSLNRNSKISAVQIILEVSNVDGFPKFITLYRPYKPDELAPFDELTMTAFEMTYVGDQCLRLSFQIRFYRQFVKPSKRKVRTLKTRRSK